MAIGRAEPERRTDLNPRDRFLAAVSGHALAFAPILWEQLPALVHQQRSDWWQDPAAGQRLIADAAALAQADAMFVFAAAEAIESAVSASALGNNALDSLAQRPEIGNGVALIRCLHDVATHGVIAAVPAPSDLRAAFEGAEIEAAEDAFSDLASAFFGAGADALAVTAHQASDLTAGVRRAAGIAGLFGRPVLGVCACDRIASGSTADGCALGVLSEVGAWPAMTAGVVITPGDVSSRWDAAALRDAGGARP
jgi:hypothetical protein